MAISAAQVLDRVLAGWPTRGDGMDPAEFRQRLQEVGHGATQASGLWIRAERGFRRGSGLILKDEDGQPWLARFAVLDGDEDLHGHLALLAWCATHWEFSSLLPRCPSCGGDGVASESGLLCQPCGALGWGQASCDHVPPPAKIPEPGAVR